MIVYSEHVIRLKEGSCGCWMVLGHDAMDTAHLLFHGVTLFLNCPAVSSVSLAGAGQRDLGTLWWKCLEEDVEFLGIFLPIR